VVGQGVDYVYFIDDNFQPWPELLEALTDRVGLVGIQTRIEPGTGRCRAIGPGRLRLARGGAGEHPRAGRTKLGSRLRALQRRQTGGAAD